MSTGKHILKLQFGLSITFLGDVNLLNAYKHTQTHIKAFAQHSFVWCIVSDMQM